MQHQGRRCGAVATPDGAVQWRVWAPRAKSMELVLRQGEQRRGVAMQRQERGYFVHQESNIPDGQRYAFRLDGGPERPDPCSLWQPDGPHAPSAVVRPERFRWTDQRWPGVPRQELVIYELHVGTFTPEGTFAAIIPRLRALRELGVTALELMPVAQFPGTRNWGYDGVSLYAAQNSYGGPAELHKLIDACHAAGLAVLLDVVYNHLGPEGNYLREFAPYFTDRYKTPWGEAFNFDGSGCDAVRDFVLDNARMWLEEFHVDGLRLDAVHAIFDLGARHLLRAVKDVAQGVTARTGRITHVIAESDQNDPRLLLPVERGGYDMDAQWADDFHHALHTFFTGEHTGYYEDFGQVRQVVQVLEQPFVYAGDYSRHRDRKYGAPPPADLTGERFVVCLQNHDQVGNRARGDRLSTLLGCPAQLRLAASLLLFSPYVPLLFMGEEYGEENPFPFFCSFGDPHLVQAVREGRKREFASFGWQGVIPDPLAEEVFVSARLSWSWPEGSPRAGLRRLYQDLLTARREWHALRDFTHRRARLLPEADTGSVLELLRGKGTLQVLFNLSARPQPLPPEAFPKGMLQFSSEARRYGGPRTELILPTEILPYEAIALSSTVDKGWGLA